MKLEGKNTWYVDENSFTIYYMRFCVRIVPKNYNIELQLFSDNQKLLSLKFLNYEEAMDFAQTYISDYHICWTVEDVQKKYDELTQDKPRTLIKRKNNLTDKINNK